MHRLYMHGHQAYTMHYSTVVVGHTACMDWINPETKDDDYMKTYRRFRLLQISLDLHKYIEHKQAE